MEDVVYMCSGLHASKKTCVKSDVVGTLFTTSREIIVAGLVFWAAFGRTFCVRVCWLCYCCFGGGLLIYVLCGKNHLCETSWKRWMCRICGYFFGIEDKNAMVSCCIVVEVGKVFDWLWVAWATW